VGGVDHGGNQQQLPGRCAQGAGLVLHESTRRSVAQATMGGATPRRWARAVARSTAATPTRPCRPLRSTHHRSGMGRHGVVDRRALLLDLLPQPPGVRTDPDGLVPGLLRAGREHRHPPDLWDHGRSTSRSTQPQQQPTQRVSAARWYASTKPRRARSTHPGIGHPRCHPGGQRSGHPRAGQAVRRQAHASPDRPR
jgi:hypothetical protein